MNTIQINGKWHQILKVYKSLRHVFIRCHRDKATWIAYQGQFLVVKPV